MKEWQKRDMRPFFSVISAVEVTTRPRDEANCPGKGRGEGKGFCFSLLPSSNSNKPPPKKKKKKKGKETPAW